MVVTTIITTDHNSGLNLKNEPIPYDIDPLLRPPKSDDEDWVPCLVPNFDEDPWLWVRHLPGIHRVQVVGQGVEVAIRKSYVPWLIQNRFLFEQCQEGSRRWHGVYTSGMLPEAIEAAKVRFLSTAAFGLSSGVGFGLDRYYHDHTAGQCDLCPAIEWAILVRDIVSSDRLIFCRFLLRCAFLGLHLLGDYNSASAREIVDRGEKEWAEHFRQLGANKVRRVPQRDLGGELHKVALLRGVLEAVGGRRDVRQHRFDLALPVNKSFAAFGDILGLNVSAEDLASFGSFDVATMEANLLASRVFNGVLPVTKTHVGFRAIPGEELLQCIPIGVPDELRRVLPTELVHSIGHGDLRKMQVILSTLYCSRLEDAEVHALVLICDTAQYPTATPGLRSWLASEKGKRFYQDTLASMRESRSLELTASAVAALLWRSRVLSLDSSLGPTNSSYLRDFARLLDGSGGLRERAVLRSVAHSFERAVGDKCHPAVRHCVYSVVEAEGISGLSLDIMDGLSDTYWSHMVAGLPHKDALEKTWEEFRSRADREDDWFFV
ncbi:hypothetical protein B0T14DRAFT_511755 [Immersiella caudata]|uniref:Uncharacterized protein n=1 Tax=Immersiella caudata TaxID=314043 RepID=A0AA39X4D0_9PEZI|nr:hypothetical protein B0T14DRAFT_511755 [Immersiella caudata]